MLCFCPKVELKARKELYNLRHGHSLPWSPCLLPHSCPFFYVMVQRLRTLQLLHVLTPWLWCGWCGYRHSQYIFSSSPPGNSWRWPSSLSIYRWKTALFGSYNMAFFSSMVMFSGGGRWQMMFHVREQCEQKRGGITPFGASASVTRLACGQRRPRGEAWPSLSSLCSVQAQKAVVTLLVLVSASQYYLVYLPCSHSLPIYLWVCIQRGLGRLVGLWVAMGVF